MKNGQQKIKIGYLCPFGEAPMAELETRIRFKYCVEQLGHEFYELNMDGFELKKGIHADSLNLDFIFSHDTCIGFDKPLPNTFSCFAQWSPNGFLIKDGFENYFKWMSKYDVIVGGYESEKILQDISNHPDININLYNITSSVPQDFCSQLELPEKLKLFYIGINLEKIQKGGTRYYKLLKFLDDNNLIDIYGPNSLWNTKNLWGDFKNYRGEIPFDGRTIIERIHQSGIVLALNSPIHNYNGTVSNRIYEAAASGAIIISDDNKYVRRYFGDSVFYIDIQKNENEQIEDIKKILKCIKDDPDTALQMAQRAQKIFIERLSLDNQVRGLISFIENEKKNVQISQDEYVDIICFVENEDEFDTIFNEINSQDYKKINIFVLTKQIFTKDNSSFKISIIQQKRTYGESFSNIIPLLTSKYFLFIDKKMCLHRNHIYKMVKAISSDKKSYFIYTGVYLKKIDEFNNTLSYSPYSFCEIDNDDLCSFTNLNDIDENFLFNIEERFAFSCCLFKRNLLNFTKDFEFAQINYAVHLYLAACSVIRANKMGHFLYTISCGYKLQNNQTIQDLFYKERFYNYTYKRTEGTFYKDLYLVFFKDGYKSKIYGKTSFAPIISSKWMKRLLKRSEKSEITSLPYFIYKAFSLYCKTKSIFKKGK